MHSILLQESRWRCPLLGPSVVRLAQLLETFLHLGLLRFFLLLPGLLARFIQSDTVLFASAGLV